MGGRGRKAVVVTAAGLVVAAGCNLGAPPIKTGEPAYDAATGDVDGDGDDDLVVTAEGGWSVLANDGAASFTATRYPFDTPGPGDYGARVDLVDLEGDGDLDVVQAVLDFDLAAYRVEVEVNDGTGGFTGGVVGRTWSSAQDTELGDVTGDGNVDLVVLHEPVNERVDVYPGDGNGGFLATSISTVTGLATGPLALGDVDGDGDLDLANILVTYVDDEPVDTLQLARNDGSGHFGAWSGTVVGHANGRVDALTDVDGDGHVDAVVRSRGQVSPAIPGDVTILYGDGAGGFGSPERWVGPSGDAFNVGDLALADIDGDGTDDIVVDTSEGALVVYRDLPGFEEREFGPRGPINAADFDGDGRVDVAVGSTVYLNRLTGR